MQIEAIYDQGRLEFVSPVKLKSGRIRVRVEIPEQAILPMPQGQAGEGLDKGYSIPETVKEKSRKIKHRLDRIRNAPLSEDDELPALADKQQERIEAFALRDEIKGYR
jgi:predicted DNA-binding antitoxin AbrB/MazE fold protein